LHLIFAISSWQREHEEFRSAEKVPGDIYGTPWGNSFRMTQVSINLE